MATLLRRSVFGSLVFSCAAVLVFAGCGSSPNQDVSGSGGSGLGGGADPSAGGIASSTGGAASGGAAASGTGSSSSGGSDPVISGEPYSAPVDIVGTTPMKIVSSDPSYSTVETVAIPPLADFVDSAPGPQVEIDFPGDVGATLLTSEVESGGTVTSMRADGDGGAELITLDGKTVYWEVRDPLVFSQTPDTDHLRHGAAWDFTKTGVATWTTTGRTYTNAEAGTVVARTPIGTATGYYVYARSESAAGQYLNSIGYPGKLLLQVSFTSGVVRPEKYFIFGNDPLPSNNPLDVGILAFHWPGVLGGFNHGSKLHY